MTIEEAKGRLLQAQDNERAAQDAHREALRQYAEAYASAPGSLRVGDLVRWKNGSYSGQDNVVVEVRIGLWDRDIDVTVVRWLGRTRTPSTGKRRHARPCDLVKV